VWLVAARLSPSPTGIGTHRQLGFPACLSPILLGFPCPTCGMTTSFAHAVRLDFFRAFHAQPAGLALFFLVAAVFVQGGRALWTGSAEFLGSRVHPGRAMLVLLGILAVGWVYKLATFRPP
jgi:hypothetical protein